MCDFVIVNMYTDGAARGNPDGPGGYGTVIHYMDNSGENTEKVEEFAGGFEVTSNNRMELLAVIVGLESVETPSVVTVYSDSKYVVNAFALGWVSNWVKNGWKTAANKPVKNKDLWDRLLDAKKIHKVNFEWVKGHDGHPENERCDYLATSMADKRDIVKGEDGIYHDNIKIEETDTNEETTDDVE